MANYHCALRLLLRLTTAVPVALKWVMISSAITYRAVSLAVVSSEVSPILNVAPELETAETRIL